jgi:hypothetical protein
MVAQRPPKYGLPGARLPQEELDFVCSQISRQIHEYVCSERAYARFLCAFQQVRGRLLPSWTSNTNVGGWFAPFLFLDVTHVFTRLLQSNSLV